MRTSLTSISEKSGMSPGALVHVGEMHEAGSRISVLDYDRDSVKDFSVKSVSELLHYKDSNSVTWVLIEGLTNIEIIESIGEIFDIHPLVLEDILNTHHRPKFEESDDYLYIVLKALFSKDTYTQENINLSSNIKFSVRYEQISILVLKNFVFTFKEKTDDLLLPVIQRIKSSKSRFRSCGPDYLAYAILDLVVDQNFTLIDELSEIIDSVEEELLANPTTDTLGVIQGIKREIAYMRRFISPLRDLLVSLLRSESQIINDKTLIYLKDVLDHVLHISEAIDSYRDIFSGLLDIYISNVSNKMNEIMKVLTVFASIFIPLTFIAGIYGMNFDYMPELRWKWAYPALWGLFIAIPVVLLVYFKKKRWL